MILQHVNWTLGKNWFSKSLKCWYILLYNIKNHLLPISSEEKSLSIGKMPSSQWDTCFPHFNFCFKNSDFYHWQQILSVVFLEVLSSLSSFLRKYLLNIQDWVTGLFTVPSNTFSMKKIAISVRNKGFSLRQPLNFIYRTVLCIFLVGCCICSIWKCPGQGSTPTMP